MYRFLRSCLVLSIATTLFSASQRPPAPTSTPTTKEPASSPKTMMPMPLVAPLFITEPGVTSTLTMVSAVNADTPVTILLRSPDGEELARKGVTVPGHSVQRWEINDILESLGREVTLGSVELDIDPALSMPVAAQLAVDGAISDLPAIHLDEEFLSPSMATMEMAPLFRPATSGEPFVAIQNLDSRQQTVTIQCITRARTETKQVVLQGAESRLLRPCAQTDSSLQSLNALKAPEKDTQPYGLSVAGAMPGSELAVFGFSVRGNDFEHLVTSINFSDIRRIKSNEWVFAGVPVGTSTGFSGSFEPRATVSNFSAIPAKVSVLYSGSQGDDSALRTLSALEVPPGTSAIVNLPHLSDAALESTFVIKSDAPPGSLVANVDAWGGSSASYVQAISKNRFQSENGGAHPWHIGATSKSELVLFNPADTPQVFNVTLHTNEGQLWYKSYTIPSHQTKVLSINEIATKRLKDDLKNMLPESSTDGTVIWWGPTSKHGVGRLVQTEPNVAVRNFSCGYQFVVCGATLDLYSEDFGIYETGSLGNAWPQICAQPYGDGTCEGNPAGGGGTGLNYYWTADDSSIAPIQGSNTDQSATFYGQSVGSTQGNIYLTDGYDCEGESQGTNTVQPTISWNNNNITSTLQNTVVGQQIVLAGVPSGGNWSFNFPVVGGFQVSSDSSSGASSAVNTSSNPVTFYWIDGGISEVTYTVSGQSSWADFGAAAPSYNGITVSTQAPTITPDNSGVPYLRLGYYPSSPPGISFAPSLTSPQGYFGLASWVQIVNATTIQAEEPTGGYTVCTAPSGLDNSIVYALQTDDSPGLSLQNLTYPSIEDTQSFSRYLMWDPNLANSIPVPIAVVNWNWDGTASLTGSSYAASGSAPQYTISPTTTYPSWTSKFTNGYVSDCAYVDGSATNEKISVPLHSRRASPGFLVDVPPSRRAGQKPSSRSAKENNQDK